MLTRNEFFDEFFDGFFDEFFDEFIDEFFVKMKSKWNACFLTLKIQNSSRSMSVKDCILLMNIFILEDNYFYLEYI